MIVLFLSLCSGNFILGIEQEAVLMFSAGSSSLKQESSVAVTTSPFFSVAPSPVTPDPTSDPAQNEESGEQVSSSGEGRARGQGMILAPLSFGSLQAIPVTVCMNMRRDAVQDLTSKVVTFFFICFSNSIIYFISMFGI